MKHTYLESVSIIPAIADLTQVDEETWEVNRINVPTTSRGMGHGTRLLKRILRDADEEGVTLGLHVLASGPLDRRTLMSWYRRHGFAPCADKHPIFEMIRSPK